MKESKLREAVDRMVEDSIRRILPRVMNEVLVSTLAEAIGGRIPSRSPSAPVVPPPRRARPAGRPSLRETLGDDSIGSDFYVRPDDVSDARPSFLQSLPPEIRELSEGVATEDGMQMWDESKDEAPPASSAIDRIASSIGIDFNRLSEVAKRADGHKTTTGEDARARAQFERQRIERMREQLDAKRGGG